MSNTPVYTGNPASPLERRQHLRRHVSALSYLEIGADNGGIALNLGEEGMAFQAVGPLDTQTDVSLRIQLPDSRTRIRTSAQIVWLGESNRQAGVRFVDMPSEGRTQIYEWVHSQISPNASSQATPGQREVVSEPQRKQETIQEPRKDKWPSLTVQLEGPKPAAGILEKRFHKAIRSTEVSPQSVPDQPRMELPISGPDRQPNGQLDGQNNGHTAITIPNNNRADKRGIDNWSIPASPPSRTVLPVVPTLSTPPPAPAEPLATDIDSKTNTAPVVASISPAALDATKRSRAQQRTAVAVLIVSVSILCFGIGTWVGSRSTRFDSVKTPPPPVAAPITTPDTSVRNRGKPNEPASAIAHKAPALHAAEKSMPESPELKSELPASSPLVPQSQQNVQSTPAEQNLTPLTATQPPENSSTPAPVPDDSAVAVPAPRIVAGRVLRPTDRFNMCHLSYRVEPAYPQEAQQLGIEGAVKIHLDIGADGTVRGMKLLSGSPLLAPAAMDAAKYWQYLPALLNGQPVETEQDIEINFRLPH